MQNMDQEFIIGNITPLNPIDWKEKDYGQQTGQVI